MKELAIGIDIGGQSAKCGVVDRNGNILNQCVISTLEPNLDIFMSQLAKAVMDLVESTSNQGKVCGIGVGAPNANYYNGTICSAPNLKWARNSQGECITVEFARILSEKTGLKVTMTNDANAAALGERTYGVARGINDFIMITLGTGVGSGIVIGGNLVYGHDGFAGELGHVCAVPGGRQCGCGLKGCLETYASATGVARTAVEKLEKDSRGSQLRRIEPQAMTSKDVYNAAVKGDQVAIEIFQETGRILGRALADFVKFSAPQAIVLFGGLTKSREFFHYELVQSMNESLMPIWKGKIEILYSTLKESDAAILGASSLAW